MLIQDLRLSFSDFNKSTPIYQLSSPSISGGQTIAFLFLSKLQCIHAKCTVCNTVINMPKS